MKSSITIMVMLALAAFAALAAPAQAAFEDVTFTEVISDEEGDDELGLGGFYDIHSVAIGVTADGDLVVRTEAAGTDSSDDARSDITFSFKANGADYKLVFAPDGSHRSSSHAAFSEEDCEVDGSTYYCVGTVGDGNIVVVDGDELESIKASSKLFTSGTGDSAEADDAYVYAAETGPTVEELTDEEPMIMGEADTPSNETVVYQWNNTLGAIEVEYAFDITNGSVSVAASTAGTSLFDETFDSSTEGTLPLEDAPEGAYNITLTYTDFTGSVHLQIAAFTPGSGSDDDNGTGDDTTGNETDVDGDDGNVTVTGNNTTADLDDAKGLPTVGVLPLLAALAGLVVAVRRRR